MKVRGYAQIVVLLVGVGIAVVHPGHHSRPVLEATVSYPQGTYTGVDDITLMRTAKVKAQKQHLRHVREAASRSAERVAIQHRPTQAVHENVQPSVSRETSTNGVPAIWAAMAQCEAGGNWASNTGNGFYGGLQFTLGTWQSYGGTGVPQSASASVQIMVARRILTTGYAGNPPQGVNAWPVCGPRVGLQPGD